MTADDLLSLGVVEQVIPETEDLCAVLKQNLSDVFARMSRLSPEELCEQRYRRFRRLGVFGE